MAKRSKYGEETIFLSVRVPKSKKDEISDRFYSILGEYVVGGIKNPLIFQKEIIVEKNVSTQQTESNNTDLTLDEIYDCIEVFKGIPDVEYRSYVNPRKDIAFVDKNDVDVYYAYWDLKYYKFANKKEFDRFLKDKAVK